jgi:RNA polymerase sigma-70 factor (ECF subfamily)
MPDSQASVSPSADALAARTDAELMALAREGEEAAFQTLYERHRNFVLRQAKRYVRQDADALDVMQEVFRYLFTLVPKYTPSAQLTTLLYKVVRNTCLSELQRQRRAFPMAMDTDEAAHLAVAPEEAGKDCPLESRHVTAAIDELADTYREVIVLRLIEEWNYQEIADALELPLGTVKSRLHNGIALLRGRLQKHLTA